MADRLKKIDDRFELKYTGALLNYNKILLTFGLILVNYYGYFQLSASREYEYKEYGRGIPVIVDKNWIPDKKRSTGDFVESMAASNFFNMLITNYPRTTRMLGLIAPIIATKMELAQEHTDPWDIFAYWAGYLAMIGIDVSLFKLAKKITYNQIVEKLIEEYKNNEVEALAQIYKEIRAMDKEFNNSKWYKLDSKYLKASLDALLELAQVMEEKVKFLQSYRRNV